MLDKDSDSVVVILLLLFEAAHGGSNLTTLPVFAAAECGLVLPANQFRWNLRDLK